MIGRKLREKDRAREECNAMRDTRGDISICACVWERNIPAAPWAERNENRNFTPFDAMRFPTMLNLAQSESKRKTEMIEAQSKVQVPA